VIAPCMIACCTSPELLLWVDVDIYFLLPAGRVRLHNDALRLAVSLMRSAKIVPVRSAKTLLWKAKWLRAVG